MVRPVLYVAVGLGSALGALLRFGCSLLLATPGGSVSVSSLALATLLSATLLVNSVGSFWIGFYAVVTGPNGRWQVSDWHKQFMLSGVCAGFTTFSVFSLEFMQLLQAGQATLAMGYLLLSVFCWLMACWAGLTAGARVNGISVSKLR